MSKPSNFDLLNAIFDDCENGSLLEQYETETQQSNDLSGDTDLNNPVKKTNKQINK